MQGQIPFILQTINEIKQTLLALQNRINSIILDCFNSIYESVRRNCEFDGNEDILKGFSIENSNLEVGEHYIDKKCEEMLKEFRLKLYSIMEAKMHDIKLDLENKRSINFITSELEVKDHINYKSKKGCIGYAMVDIESWNLLSVGTNEGDIFCFDLHNFQLISEYNHAHSGWIMCLNYHNNLNLLFSTSTDKTIKVFSIQNKNLILITTLNSHKDSVNGILFIPNQNLFVSFGRGNEIKLWDTYSLLEIDTIICDEDKMGMQACYIDQLSAFGIGFYNSKIKFFNIYSKTCILTLDVNNSGYFINSLIYDPKSQRLIAQANAKMIRIWKFKENTFDLEKDIKVKGHSNYFILINDILLTCCDQPNIEIWDIEKLEKIKEISLPSQLKNSNGILLLNRDNVKYLIVSSWNVNKIVVFNEKL